MTELIVALLGAAGGVIILRLVTNSSIKRHQEKLDKFTDENAKKQARLEGEQAQEDKQTQEKVDEITKEQNDKPSGNSLAEWFNRRKR